MTESVAELIQRAEGDRGRLTEILLRLQSDNELRLTAADWSTLAQELQHLGCFAQVLELCELADAAGVEDFNLLAKAATAASNLGLTGSYVETLERAVKALPESATAEMYEEVLGGLGRQYKASALLFDDPAERRRLLLMSLDAYQQAYTKTQRLWSGVNVAAVSLLLGGTLRAHTLAATLGAEANRRAQGSADEGLHWLKAIEGECDLIQGRLQSAAAHYRSACDLAAKSRHYGDVASMRRQASLLLEAIGADADLALQWLPCARLAVFSGHLVDAADRPEPRFPAAQLEPVAAKIEDWLQDKQTQIAVCSLSAGADLLFAESVLKLGLELHLVLPASKLELSALAQLDQISNGPERIEKIVNSATSVRELVPGEAHCEVVDYVYLNAMIFGTAEFLRQPIDGAIAGLAVWDGRQGGGPGGSADAIRGMQDNGWSVSRIDPIDLSLSAATQVPGPTTDFLSVRSHLKALVFGDFVGFSKLGRAQLKEFYEHVLSTVGDVVDAIPACDSPCARNTWGDGLFLAFNSVLAAAQFSLRLQAALRDLGEEQGGVASKIRLRLAVHYGPTLSVTDPVTKQPNVVGMHVSRAARLEPATAPGEVYASEAFASRLMLEQDTGLACQYLKNLPWAKGYGVFPTFRLINSLDR